MAYRKSGEGRGRPTEFRDGQPVSHGEKGGRGGYAKRRNGDEPASVRDGAQGRGERSPQDKKPGFAPRGDKPYRGTRDGEDKRGGRTERTDREGKSDYPFKTASEQEQERGGRYGDRPGRYSEGRGGRPGGKYSPRRNEGRGEGFGDKRAEGYGDKRNEGFSDKRSEGYADKRNESYGDKRGEKYQERKPYAPREESAPVLNDDELPYILMGRNAVKEALKSGRSIDRILVQEEPDGSLREILALARENNVQYREVERGKLDEMCMPFGHGRKTGNHQGIVAQVPGVQYCEIADILEVAEERGEKPFVIVLDGIEDPHNLGSILRSAECAGAHGVIIPKRRATGVTSAACKASAGAVEYIKVAQVANLSGALARLKDAGMWIAGADMSGEPMEKVDLKGAIALVVGSEGRGISDLVKKNCDFLVSIPMKGRIGSLNASVAAAVLMYEKMRRDAR